jgi:hypothetical protein
MFFKQADNLFDLSNQGVGFFYSGKIPSGHFTRQ